MKKALVVPTIREESIKAFLKSWSLSPNKWDWIIVVEDNPEKSFKIDVDHHVSWEEIENDLGTDSWIISRRDSAIRSYGFLMAHRLKADYIFTLDDDCLANGRFANFIKQHIDNLENTPKWTPSVPDQRTRGLPYKNLGKLRNVVFSVGLWEGNPDFDALQSLVCPQQSIDLPKGTRVMPFGQYFPICGMNLAFKREACPMTYFPLQGEGRPFSRFDDIWFGIIAKKICDHIGLLITCGEPHIYHSKSSNPMVNLIKEAPGIAFNETFWEIIDGIRLVGKTPLDCMYEIANHLQAEELDYIKDLGNAMFIWCSLFS